MKPIPLSFQQEFHWDNARRLCDLNLNFPFALLIRGALDIERLRASFEVVIRRQAALRTRIVVSGGAPGQIVDTACRFRLEVMTRPHDLDSEVERYLNSPFDLVGGPLLRARLLRLSSCEYVLLVCAHHLIIDAYSVNVLSDELWQCYSAPAAALPTLHTTYSSYTIRQRAAHNSWLESYQGQWQERLADAVPLRLPAERTPAIEGTDAVGSVQIELEARLTAAVNTAARRWQTMPAMLVLTAFVMMLSRWSKQDDFLVPLVFSGRDDPDALNLVGFFSYVLLLRMELAGALDFQEVRGRVNQEFSRACARQDHGRVITGLLESLPAQEGMKLFSTSFNWLSMSSGELAGCPSQAILRGLHKQLLLSPFPFRFRPRYCNDVRRSRQGMVSEAPALGLQVTQGSVMEVTLLYSPGSLSPGSIEVFAGRLLTALEQAVA